MTIEELEAELLRLDPSERAKLAERLLRSLDTLSDEENERLWAEEALRRRKELRDGLASSLPAHEVLRRARERTS